MKKLLVVLPLLILIAAHVSADDKDKDKKKDPKKKDVSDSFCFQHIQSEYDERLGDQAWSDHKRQSGTKKAFKYIAKNLAFVVGFGTSAVMPMAGHGANVILGGMDTGGLIGQLSDAKDQRKQRNIDDLGWVMNVIKQSYNFDDGDYDADQDERDGVIRFSSMVRAAWRAAKPKKCDTDGTCEVLAFPHFDADDPSESDQHIAEDIRKLDEASEKAEGKTVGKDGKPVGGLCQLVTNKDVKDPSDDDKCKAKSKWAYSDDHPCQHWEIMPIPDLVFKIIQMEKDRKDPPPKTDKPADPQPLQMPPCRGADCVRAI